MIPLGPKDRKNVTRIVFRVRGIDCATCAIAIEKQVKRLEGVERVGTALMLDEVFIDYDEAKVGITELMKAVDRAGYSSHIVRRKTETSVRDHSEV